MIIDSIIMVNPHRCSLLFLSFENYRKIKEFCLNFKFSTENCASIFKIQKSYYMFIKANEVLVMQPF